MSDSCTPDTDKEPTPISLRWLRFRIAILVMAIVGLMGTVLHRMHELQVENTEFENLAQAGTNNATLAKLIAELSARLHTEVEKWISPTP